MRLNAQNNTFGLARLNQKLENFRRDERGVMAIFTVYLLVAMLLITGLAIDVSRVERVRSKLQNALDRSILVATSLDRTRDAKSILLDNMRAEGFGSYITPADIKVNSTPGSRSITASASLKVPSLFLDMVGIDFMIAPASSAAEQSATNFEIVMVLDVSGSMNGGGKIYDLRRAAKEFVNIILSNETAKERISIGIVPYNGQVRAHPSLLKHFNLVVDDNDTNTANNVLMDPAKVYSDCVLFREDDFKTTAMTPDLPLRGASDLTYFEMAAPFVREDYPRKRDTNTYCGREHGQMMTLPTSDVQVLHDAIDKFMARGNTSIDYGMKWGTALLDPAFKPVMTELVASNEVSDVMTGRPFDFGQPETRKIIVLMSDGENTPQYRINLAYQSGPSNVWATDNHKLTFVSDGEIYNQWGTKRNSHYWGARRLDWAEVWDRYGVQWITRRPGTPSYGQVVSHGKWPGGTWTQGTLGDGFEVKNDRTKLICDAFKNQANTASIYAIAFQAGGLGPETLEDCATSPEAPFYQYVNSGGQLRDTFEMIARDISKLRLTQ